MSASIAATQISRPPQARRTFAIIAHPDAGKTTLTEKLLLFSGAIRLAGHVKARRQRRHTRSDWMEVERARGISVSSSVMTFEHDGIIFNLLDTPGHEDFSEDTYRTLTAVDSAIMVIDAAKGIESQTRKLFEVCRLRDVPILTFINKIDREGRDPFELMDEIADVLALDVAPLTWPLGMGGSFRGCYGLHSNRLLLPKGEQGTPFGRILECSGLDDPQLDEQVPAAMLAKLREDANLAVSGYPALDIGAYLGGHLTPVYFGSALKDFALTELLEGLTRWAPGPRPQPANLRDVSPREPKLTGFVFKVQANMDPNHRDRVAFVRLCSGQFHRGMKLTQVRTNKSISTQNPIFFFARERDLAEEAWPGDIIGIPNHGVLRVGDTLTEGEPLQFKGIPNFAPEILRRVRLLDPMRSKQLVGALEDLAEEGVAQLFVLGADRIVGVVGALQLEILSARMQHEYKVSVQFESIPYEVVRWVSAGSEPLLKRFVAAQKSSVASDRDHNPVFFARNAWELNHTIKEWPDIQFTALQERS